ncbi:MAG: HdeD family acid-resistance protein [Bryobacteraceae bacterium]|jgi:uncharacterized membrane protein HdeD (DUF308 family)
MSTLSDNPIFAGIEEIKSSWVWFLTLGVLFVVLGMACIAFDVTATFTTVLVFGWMLLIGGLFALIQAFTTGTWSGFFLFLLSALFRGFTGYLLVRYPLTGAESLTLVLASFFIVGGMFRAIGFGVAKFPRWGWAVFSGIVSVALGVTLLAQWPVVSVWFIGFAIGLDLVFDGTALIGFATKIHGLTRGMFFKHA